MRLCAGLALSPLLSFLLLGWLNSAAAQTPSGHAGHVHTKAATSSSAVAIDGAVHPELISDQEAMTVFWISIMEAPSAGEVEKNRFAAKTATLNLNPDDKALLWAAAQDFYAKFMPYREQAQQYADAAVGKRASTDPPLVIAQHRASVATAIDQLASNTHTGLLAKLSPTAAASFKTALADVKAHMKIIPPPKM
jgi:hypothetical protein